MTRVRCSRKGARTGGRGVSACLPPAVVASCASTNLGMLHVIFLSWPRERSLREKYALQVTPLPPPTPAAYQSYRKVYWHNAKPCTGPTSYKHHPGGSCQFLHHQGNKTPQNKTQVIIVIGFGKGDVQHNRSCLFPHLSLRLVLFRRSNAYRG